MSFFRKITFIFATLLPTFTTRAAIPADTVNKRILAPVNKMDYQGNDYALFLQAVAAIKADSVTKGIHLIATTMQHAARLRKMDMILPYQGLEFYKLIELIDNGNLPIPDRRLGEVFVKAAFVKDDELQPDSVDRFFKYSSNSTFTKRLKVMLLSVNYDSKLNKELNSLLKANPDLVTANTLKAEVLYAEEKYNESISYANKVIALLPEYAHAYFVLAGCYTKLNQHEKALNYFDHVLRLFPANMEALYGRAGELYDLDQYDKAVAGYKKVFTANPLYRWVNYNLARCYKQMDMPDSALHYTELHIKQYPEDGSGYNLRGDVFYHKEDYKSALELYTRAIHLSPYNSYYYEDRGDAYFYSDQFDEAMADFKKAIELDNKRSYLYDRLGDCHYQKKEYEQAIPCHQMALKIDPH